MGVRKISISLDEDLYERARTVADAEGLSLSSWLSRAAAEAADLASKRQAMDEYVAYFGEPSEEDRAAARESLERAGFFAPLRPEMEVARLEALAKLRQGAHYSENPAVTPEETLSAPDERRTA